MSQAYLWVQQPKSYVDYGGITSVLLLKQSVININSIYIHWINVQIIFSYS